MSMLYSVGQMNQLGDALEASGYTPDDVTKLRTSPHLDLIRGLIRGQLEVAVTRRIIDCDANPFIPDGWEVFEHKKGGKFEWSSDAVALYLDKGQKDGSIVGNELRKKLEGQPVLNACVLDYLLANHQLIPESWKGRAVFFWGTIYRNSYGNLSVRYLYWGGDRWYWHYNWLGNGWGDGNPAAVRASK